MSNIHVLRHGEPTGPFSEDEIRAQVARAELTPADYAWREGMATWQPVGEVVPLTAARHPIAPPPAPTPAPVLAPAVEPRPRPQRVPPVHMMTGLTEFLEVFPDKLTITPKGGEGLKTNGSQGIRTIPMHLFLAIGFKLPNFTSGSLQFTLSERAKGRGGRARSPRADENMFRFLKNDENVEAAGRIAAYVEERIREGRAVTVTPGQAPVSLSDELAKLAALRDQGVLTDAEFQQAKARLLA